MVFFYFKSGSSFQRFRLPVNFYLNLPALRDSFSLLFPAVVNVATEKIMGCLLSKFGFGRSSRHEELVEEAPKQYSW